MLSLSLLAFLASLTIESDYNSFIVPIALLPSFSTCRPCTKQTNANGYVARYDAVSRCFVAAGRCRGYLKSQLRLSNAGAKWFQLVCGIGNYVYQLQCKSASRPVRQSVSPSVSQSVSQ